tara:strand:- start:394 stop:759 length:366 start_codon:yes stop_codon:yes gene_type:complete
MAASVPNTSTAGTSAASALRLVSKRAAEKSQLAATEAAADQSPERTETDPCLVERAWEDVKAQPQYKVLLKNKNINTLEEALQDKPLRTKIHTTVGTYLDDQHETCPCRKCAGTGKSNPGL